MPMSLANLFRFAVLIALAVHVFMMYSFARGMAEHAGFGLGVAIRCAVFSLILLVPFVWVYWIADLPIMYRRWWKPRRRWKRGECPHCGYPFEGSSSQICSECGMQRIPPPEQYSFSLSTIGRFVALIALAWVCGAAAGETWFLEDGRAFAAEVEARLDAGKNRKYARQMHWPNGNCSYVYVPGVGIFAHE